MDRHTGQKRAWVALAVSAAAFLIYGFGSGLRANYGVMLESIAERSGVDYASVSFALSVGQLTVGIVQPLFGALALKKSNSFVLAVGAMLIAGGLLGTPFCRSAFSLTILVGIILSGGTGAMAFGIVMAAITPVLGEKKAAVVSGFVSASSGVVGTILAPVMSFLIVRLGLQGMMLALCVPTALIFLISVTMGREEDTRQFGTMKESLSVPGTIRDAMADPSYRAVFLAFGTCGYYMCIIETHLFSQYKSYGFSDSLVAAAMSVYGIGAMAGCILTGFLDSIFPNRFVLAGTYWSRILIALSLIFLPKSLLQVMATAFLLGCSGNATVPPTSGLITKRFGSRKLGILFGTAFLFHQIGAFFSGWLGGVLLEKTGTYDLIWISSMVLSLLAGLLVVRVKDN